MNRLLAWLVPIRPIRLREREAWVVVWPNGGDPVLTWVKPEHAEVVHVVGPPGGGGGSSR